MPIGIGAAMLIGTAASAGAGLAAAKIQSNAANKAQKAQQQGTDQALVAQRKANQPYMDLGQQGVNRLMNTPQQNYTPRFSGAGGSDGFQAFQGPPPMASLGSLGQPPQGPNGPMPMNGPGIQVQPGPRVPPNGPMPQQIGPQAGQMAQMQGPDGSVKAVPLHLVAQLEARGARRVG